jgi:hypothetical protein
MAYTTANPPALVTESPLAGAGQTWHYSSADGAATVDTSGYITDGGSLGMLVGDIVIVRDTATPLVTSHLVISVSSTYPGAVDLSNGTTIGLNTNSD